MHPESEIEIRRRKLREQKELLRGLQASHKQYATATTQASYPRQSTERQKHPSATSHKNCAPTSATFRASSPAGQNPTERQKRPPTRTANAKPKNSIQDIVCHGVDVPPSPTTVPKKNSKPNSKQTTSEPFQDLFGEDGYVLDYEDLTLTTQNSTEEDVSRIDGIAGKNHSGAKDSPLSFKTAMRDKKCSERRTVNAIKFHKKIGDAVLSAHGQRSDGKLGVSEGTIGLWTLHAGKGSLQRCLIATSAITALELPALSPTLVIAGTQNGSVHMWDTRVKTALPINTFSQNVEDSYHFHGRNPICAIKTTAMPSPFFISTSASGHICKWTISKPDSPISQGILQDVSKTTELAIACAEFPRTARLYAEERNTARGTSCFVGALNGTIHRIDESTSAWNLDTGRATHNAPVTAISAHPFGNQVAYLDDIIASASRDWSVRLWHFRRGQSCDALRTFDMAIGGAVHDVQWSTVHPTVFCAGDDSGTLSLFDVSGHLSAERKQYQWQFLPPGNEVNPAIKRVQWSNNCQQICTGDEEGNLGLWNCNPSFAALPDAEWMAQYLKAASAGAV